MASKQLARCAAPAPSVRNRPAEEIGEIGEKSITGELIYDAIVLLDNALELAARLGQKASNIPSRFLRGASSRLSDGCQSTSQTPRAFAIADLFANSGVVLTSSRHYRRLQRADSSTLGFLQQFECF